MEAYLDNSATTRCYDEVRDAVVRCMMDDYGNPSSMHLKGVETEMMLRNAAETFAKILRVQSKEIFFTSGGTESNNWALWGSAMAGKRRGNHIITTAIEHAAIAEPAAALEKQGFRITKLPVDSRGLVDPKDVEAALCDDTILVSVMFVNNEVGSVQPIAEIGEIVKKKNPNTYFHVDAIQGFGKYQIYPNKMKIDMLSVSAHKIHGPKGVGLLYVKDKTRIQPFILGGGQQNGMRSGTDNVPGVVGFAEAAKRMYAAMEKNVSYMRELKVYFLEGLSGLEDVVLHSDATEQGAPHIINASFMGVRSEVLLHTLEDRGIYVSAGSACSSHKRAGSATLTAMGCSKQEMESAVRFSFCEETTKEELDYTLQVLGEVLPMLRRFVRR